MLEKYKDASSEFIVDVAELLGAETNIHISIANNNIIAKVSARSDLAMHSKIKLAINMEKTHFFDPETELRIVK